MFGYSMWKLVSLWKNDTSVWWWKYTPEKGLQSDGKIPWKMTEWL